MKFSKTLAHTTAIILLGTSVVHAETNWDLDAQGKIDQLPDSGTVSLTGTVSNVRDEDSFSIEDATGNSIDVHSTKPLNLTQGTRVKVRGQMDDEAIGLGEEINNASVEVLGTNRAAANTGLDRQQGRTAGVTATGETNRTASNNYGTDAGVEGRTAGVTAGTAGRSQIGDANRDSNLRANRDNMQANRDDTKMEADAKVRVSQAPEDKARQLQDRRQNAQARRDLPTNRNLEDSYDVEVDTDADMAMGVDNERVSANAGEFSTFENLPKQGRIAVSGTVARVNNDNKFTLRDTTGETIDVNSVSSVAVNEGDQVKVMGQVKSEFLGMGQEIEATDVVRQSNRR